ncbi:hypothetical protein BDW22DRAFT_1330430 [Trametopsis cervina]|nr:hypothetical protein BDW22DRAFT_1330430 [Trametopsis cervina]
MVRELPHVVARTADEVVGSGAHTAGTDALTESVTHSAETRPLTSGQERQLRKANTISFAQREKDEMRELTQASEIVTLPVGDDEERREFSGSATSGKWDPRKGQLFLGNANDVPVPTPPPVMRRGQVPSMHEEWEYKSNDPAMGLGFDICIECDDMSPFPTTAHMRAAEDHIARLERRWAEQCLKEMEEAAPGGRVDPSREIPVRPPPSAGLVLHLPFPSSVSYAGNSILPFVSWLEGLMRPVDQPLTVGVRTRPLKILVYSADGYTESSSLALCVLMALRRLSLPEAYLELQLEKRRSFFVYQGELTSLRRVEARLERDRMVDLGSGYGPGVGVVTRTGRPAAASVSFASTSAPTSFLASPRPADALAKRPRASTLPPPPSMGTVVSDHQLWFNDARFDGSFPSRVLPFLYLGNLNHAANAYMLHALGITHVVSVGECALIPPGNAGESCGYSTTTAKPGSLWIEEKEGRIKVLDIKGVSDDGIDSLEPQLPPICEWIDEARRSGGKVLVHCRVGVSRSATVTIAYVMKHLNIPLVDAYLIVRSRRLSVLIQPNMRLLYNLIGWEVRLAQERAGGDQDRLHEELARCLNWPYLAKEVHTLNEKYLH